MSFCRRMDALFVVMVAVLLVGSLGPKRALASDVIKFEVDFFEDGEAEAVNHATIWTSDRKVRVDQKRPGGDRAGSSLVYRGDQDLVISISDQTKSYVTVERRLLSLAEGRIRAGRRSVQTHLTGLPSDQRKGLETLLGVGREDPNAVTNPITVVVVPPVAGRLDEVAGFACARKRMQRGSVVVGEACVADWDRIGMQPADMEVFRSLANFQRDALGARQLTPLEIVPNQPLDLIVQFGGIPLSFERQIGDHRRSAVKVTAVDWVPDEGGSLFEAPASYTATSGFKAIMSHLADSGSEAAPEADGADQPAEAAQSLADISAVSPAALALSASSASLASSPPAAAAFTEESAVTGGNTSPVQNAQPPASPASSGGSATANVSPPASPAPNAMYGGQEALRRVRAAQGRNPSAPRVVGATRDRRAPVRLFPNR